MGIRAGADRAELHVEAAAGINWLQALEGGIDFSHVSFLHRGDLDSDPLFSGAKANQYNLRDSRPVFEVVESPAASTSARGATPTTAITTGASRNG